MLKHLHIKNVAVINEAEVDFGEGLNVLTGETGAGKSIVIDSINLILGERGGRELVRHGEKSALIEAVFEPVSAEASKIASDYDDESDEEIILARKIGENGKSSCRINAALAPSSALRDVGTYLIDIHGQHDSQALLAPPMHISFLDSLEKEKIGNVKEKYGEIYEKYILLSNKLDALVKNEADRGERIEFLSFRTDEIEKANLKLGEEEELLGEERLLSNAEDVIKTLSEAYSILYDGEFTVYEALSSAARRLSDAAEFDLELDEDAERLNEILYETGDIASRVRQRRDALDFDPERLLEVQDRLALISSLKRKYGCDVEEIIEKYEQMVKELDELTGGGENAEAVKARLDECRKELEGVAKELTCARTEAKKRMEAQVEKELSDLDMEKVKFVVDIQPAESFGKNGCDKVEFMISTNPGEPVKPLAKIASGGELSRIMLALKVVLADGDVVGTLIFDEIDTGVSGRAAGKIATKLCKIAKRRQVICITHLAQIACAADNHYLIKKDTDDLSSSTHIDLLDEEERVDELARIIGGINVTDTALAHARQMRDEAEKMKAELL